MAHRQKELRVRVSDLVRVVSSRDGGGWTSAVLTMFDVDARVWWMTVGWQPNNALAL